MSLYLLQTRIIDTKTSECKFTAKQKEESWKFCSPGIKCHTSLQAQDTLANRQRSPVVLSTVCKCVLWNEQVPMLLASLLCGKFFTYKDSLTLLLGILNFVQLQPRFLGTCHLPLVLSVSAKSSSRSCSLVGSWCCKTEIWKCTFFTLDPLSL